MSRPSQYRRLMQHAYVEQEQSTCTRNQVGCVIARDRRIIATGYNGAPGGMPHCNHQAEGWATRQVSGGEFDPEPMREALGPIPRGGCKESVHAEANALAFAARHGLPTLNADLYTTLSPCYGCAQLIINAGINQVVFDRIYRDKSGLKLLVEAEVLVTWIGAIKE